MVGGEMICELRQLYVGMITLDILDMVGPRRR